MDRSNSEKLIESVVNLYFLKEELKGLLENEGLSSAGKKEELYFRLRENANFDVFSFLYLLREEELVDCIYMIKDASGYDIEISEERDDLVINIAEFIFDYMDEREYDDEREKIIKRHGIENNAFDISMFNNEIRDQKTMSRDTNLVIPVEKTRKSEKENIIKLNEPEQLRELKKRIQKWIPNKLCNNKLSYQLDLIEYLRKTNYDVTQESKIGDLNIDILIDGKYPIKINLGTNIDDIEKMKGQMMDYVDFKGCGILVLIDFNKLEKLFDLRKQLIGYFENKIIVLVK